MQDPVTGVFNRDNLEFIKQVSIISASPAHRCSSQYVRRGVRWTSRQGPQELLLRHCLPCQLRRATSLSRVLHLLQVASVYPDKNTKLIVTCWGGGLSRTASVLLVAAGYPAVYNLQSGFSSSSFSSSYNVFGADSDWKGQAYPIESVSRQRQRHA